MADKNLDPNLNSKQLSQEPPTEAMQLLLIDCLQKEQLRQPPNSALTAVAQDLLVYSFARLGTYETPDGIDVAVIYLNDAGREAAKKYKNTRAVN